MGFDSDAAARVTGKTAVQCAKVVYILEQTLYHGGDPNFPHEEAEEEAEEEEVLEVEGLMVPPADQREGRQEEIMDPEEVISQAMRKFLKGFIARFSASKSTRIEGKHVRKECQDMGLDLTKTFESKIQPNLFFAGEVINVDAITGGEIHWGRFGQLPFQHVGDQLVRDFQFARINFFRHGVPSDGRIRLNTLCENTPNWGACR